MFRKIIKKLININFLGSVLCTIGNSCSLYWCKSVDDNKNFGDKLNPYLFEHIIGKKVFYSLSIINFFHSTYVMMGSILDNNKVKSGIVIGAGFQFEDAKVNFDIKKIVAVRGKISRKILINNGYSCPEIFCDPAMLIPLFFSERVSKIYDYGIILHYADINDFQNIKINSQNKKYIIIDIQDDIDSVIKKVKQCKNICSSSLHGLILANSYSIPWIWLSLGNNIVGGDIKFNDFFSSINIDRVKKISINNEFSLVNQSFDFSSNSKNVKEYIESLMNEKIITKRHYLNLIDKFSRSIYG